MHSICEMNAFISNLKQRYRICSALVLRSVNNKDIVSVESEPSIVFNGRAAQFRRLIPAQIKVFDKQSRNCRYIAALFAAQDGSVSLTPCPRSYRNHEVTIWLWRKVYGQFLAALVNWEMA